MLYSISAPHIFVWGMHFILFYTLKFYELCTKKKNYELIPSKCLVHAREGKNLIEREEMEKNVKILLEK